MCRLSSPFHIERPCTCTLCLPNYPCVGAPAQNRRRERKGVRVSRLGNQTEEKRGHHICYPYTAGTNWFRALSSTGHRRRLSAPPPTLLFSRVSCCSCLCEERCTVPAVVSARKVSGARWDSACPGKRRSRASHSLNSFDREDASQTGKGAQRGSVVLPLLAFRLPRSQKIHYSSNRALKVPSLFAAFNDEVFTGIWLAAVMLQSSAQNFL